jgi:hypothetical protein
LSEDRIAATSRYAAVERTEFRLPDGTPAPCLKRRFVPRDPGTVVGHHAVVEGDRPDLLAARYFGDPEQFWRLADANAVLHPGELTDEVGERLNVALPGGGGA